MDIIPSESLIKFNNNCAEHIQSFKKIKGYAFNSDTELIKKLFNNTHFKGGVFFEQEDLKKYIVEDSFVVGIDFDDELLIGWKYLFDAFNVYWCGGNIGSYIRDSKLTQKWRKIMKEAFPESTYSLDLRIHIEDERQKQIAEINEKYNEEINNI